MGAILRDNCLTYTHTKSEVLIYAIAHDPTSYKLKSRKKHTWERGRKSTHEMSDIFSRRVMMMIEFVHVGLNAREGPLQATEINTKNC